METPNGTPAATERDDLVPGWYPDPGRGADTCRWWTGAAWSDLLTNDADAPPPPADAQLRLVAVVERTRSSRGVVALIGSAVLVIIFLVAATTVGSARGTGQPVLPRDPIPTGPAPSAAPAWVIAADQTMTYGTAATARFPGEPYSRPTKPNLVYGLFRLGTSVSAVTSPKSGTTPEWTASVASGWVDGSLATDNPQTTAENVLRQLPEQIFSSAATTTTETTSLPVPGFEEDIAAKITAKIGYSIPGLAATHDDVVIIVVRTDPVNYAVWLASVPDDAPEPIRRATTAAEAAVQVR